MRRAVPLVRTVSTAAASASPGPSLKVGDALRSARRRFTADDVAAYAAVSGDRNPVHLDDAFARSGSAGAALPRGCLVHGMLAASLFPALIASRFPGALYASQTLRFMAPVYVGDEAVAEVRAIHISVKFVTNCFTFTNADDREELTLSINGEVMAFLPTLELSQEEAPIAAE
ncbi:hypothetical protein ACQ4PT_007734 [Festuca glaucescens]